jgi:hypothetical protein
MNITWVINKEEEEELHQSSQRRLIRRNTNKRTEYPSTNLETVINVADDQKKVGLPNKSTQRKTRYYTVVLVGSGSSALCPGAEFKLDDACGCGTRFEVSVNIHRTKSSIKLARTYSVQSKSQWIHVKEVPCSGSGARLPILSDMVP